MHAVCAMCAYSVITSQQKNGTSLQRDVPTIATKANEQKIASSKLSHFPAQVAVHSAMQRLTSATCTMTGHCW
jgi:hypothetical protein